MSDATDDLEYNESGLQDRFRYIDRDLWHQQREKLLKATEKMPSVQVRANTKPLES